MMDIDTILVVMDPTKAEQVIVARSIRIAQALEARLELFEANFSTTFELGYPFDGTALGQAREVFLDKRRNALEAIAAQAQAQGVMTKAYVCWERPLYAVIVERAQEIGAQLIIKATHHHSALNRALFTNTDWHLIREARTPVWFIREEHIWGSHLELLAAVDPMSYKVASEKLNPRILELAHQLSCCLPSALSVGHAYEPIPSSMLVEFDTVVADYEGYRRRIKTEHQNALNQLLQAYVESSTKIYLEEAAPETFLPEVVAREGIDILVMGAISRSGLDRLFIGSTAERVLEHIRCDVLVATSDSGVK